ncbi:hypothetical protein LTS10_004820 [Elasticomyces elasticus]|nr:hypothetical protein LTS10_004820 [Elasticomyces elasticus]
MSAPQASQGGFPTHTVGPTNSTGAQAIADECDLLRRRIRALEAEVRGIRLAFEGILMRGTGQPTSAPPYIPSSACLNSFSVLPSPAPTSSRGSISEEEFFKLFVPFGPFSTTGSGSEPGVASGEAVHFIKEADEHNGSQVQNNSDAMSRNGEP